MKEWNEVPHVLKTELVERQVAEISRVLKPGGLFVASTFLQSLAPLGQILGDDVVRPLSQARAPSSAEVDTSHTCTGRNMV